MSAEPLPDLKRLTREELAALLAELGQPAWQAGEVRRFLFAKGVTDAAALTTLPKPVRAALAARCTIGAPEVADRREAPDGTVKLLLRFPDGAACETVLMPEPARVTQCLSSQAGCPLACAFCRTGGLGLARSLHWSEIVDQWLAGRRALPRGRRVTNLVFMGMGEPLLNRAALEEAVRFLISPEGGGIAAGRVTVSTAGIVPGIDWLGETLPQVKLAVSLNAPDDELRSRLMPVNRTHPLRELLGGAAPLPDRAAAGHDRVRPARRRQRRAGARGEACAPAARGALHGQPHPLQPALGAPVRRPRGEGRARIPAAAAGGRVLRVHPPQPRRRDRRRLRPARRRRAPVVDPLVRPGRPPPARTPPEAAPSRPAPPGAGPRGRGQRASRWRPCPTVALVPPAVPVTA